MSDEPVDLVLVGHDGDRREAMEGVRAVTGFGAADAMRVLERAPTAVLAGRDRAAAERAAETLRRHGVVTEIRSSIGVTVLDACGPLGQAAQDEPDLGELYERLAQHENSLRERFRFSDESIEDDLHRARRLYRKGDDTRRGHLRVAFGELPFLRKLLQGQIGLDARLLQESGRESSLTDGLVAASLEDNRVDHRDSQLALEDLWLAAHDRGLDPAAAFEAEAARSSTTLCEFLRGVSATMAERVVLRDRDRERNN